MKKEQLCQKNKTHTRISHTWEVEAEGSEFQDHLQLHSKFKTSFGYRRMPLPHKNPSYKHSKQMKQTKRNN